MTTSLPVRQCRSCRADIVWAITRSNTPMPLDAEPSPVGNVQVDDLRNATVLGPLDLLMWDREATPLYMPHHATCPDGEEWKR